MDLDENQFKNLDSFYEQFPISTCVNNLFNQINSIGSEVKRDLFFDNIIKRRIGAIYAKAESDYQNNLSEEVLELLGLRETITWGKALLLKERSKVHDEIAKLISAPSTSIEANKELKQINHRIKVLFEDNIFDDQQVLDSLSAYQKEINLSDKVIDFVIKSKEKFDKKIIEDDAGVSALVKVNAEFWRNLKSYTDLKNYLVNDAKKPNLKNLLRPRDGIILTEADLEDFKIREVNIKDDIRNSKYINFSSITKMLLNENHTLDYILNFCKKQFYHLIEKDVRASVSLRDKDSAVRISQEQELKKIEKYFYALRLNKHQKLYGIMSNEWLKDMGLDLSKNACMNILKDLATSITLTINNKDLADFENRLNEQSNSQKGFSRFIESILESKGRKVDCSNLINQIPKGLKCVINKHLKHTIAKKMIDKFKKEENYDEDQLKKVIQQAELTKEELSIS